MTTTESSTEIVLRDGSTTVAVSDEFRSMFPALAPDPELEELLGDAMEGIEISPNDLPRIKVPSGGGQFWTVKVDGEDTTTKKLVGVLVFHKSQRVFWEDPEPKGLAPNCVSLDNVRPESGGMFAADGPNAAMNPTGLCANCPMSQKGSDLKGGKGSACKQQMLLFLLNEGQMLPVVVTVPPSSRRSIQQFIVNLVQNKTPWWQVKVELTLEKASNSAGNEFARIVAKSLGKLSDDEAKAVKDYGSYIRAMVESSMGEFVDAPAAAADVEAEGGVKVGQAG